MAASSSLVNALVMYAKESPENKANLICWRDAAIASIAEGNGGQVVSGSGNGMSFTIGNSKMTNNEWFEALQGALTILNSKARRRVSRGRFS